MPKRRNWSREEIIIAFSLYCKIPFGRIHTSNPEIISLARLFKRSPSAVAWKLANFANLDTSIKQKGASHISKTDTAIYEEFCNDWEALSFESGRLLAEFTGTNIEEVAEIDKASLPREGREREAAVKIRINQNFFRKAVLAAYDYRCCITGLSVPDLLIASHIIPWSVDQKNRVNPRNGLCLNALHDRAFDRGLLTITTDFKVKLSRTTELPPNDSAYEKFLQRYDDRPIYLPDRFSPDPSLLARHNREFFEN